MDLDLTFNFDWDAEWQLRQTYSTASMCAALLPNTLMMRSVKPLMTAGCLWKSGAELTIPKTRASRRCVRGYPAPSSDFRELPDQ